MRALSAALQAAVDAVVTSPGHLLNWALPTPVYWSDIGQVTIGAQTFAAMDMRISALAFVGDAKPQGFTLEVGNLDNAVGALVLANDVANAPIYVNVIDRAALAGADVVYAGQFQATQIRIGLEKVTITCVPNFFTAPFRRVDAANGFIHATPEGTVLTWGADQLILDRLNSSTGYIYETR